MGLMSKVEAAPDDCLLMAAMQYLQVLGLFVVVIVVIDVNVIDGVDELELMIVDSLELEDLWVSF